MNAPMELPNQIVTIANGQAVTTSLAIAQGTDNEHASVILLVRKYQEDLSEFGLVDFKSESTGGRPVEYAVLNEQQSTLLLTYMRNSDIVRRFKKALVKAFFELAQAAKPIDPMVALSDPATMRGLLLTYTEKVLTLESKVGELAPKAEALDRIAKADGSVCISTAAKILQVRPKEAFSQLSFHKWIFKRHGGGPWLGYQDKIQQGLLEMKVDTIERSDGSEKTVERVLITTKGLAKLAVMLGVSLPANDIHAEGAA